MTRAVVFDAFGPPDVLRVAEVAQPQAGPGEVRVRVKAAGVQPFDLMVRRGDAPPFLTVRFPQTLGREYSGTVDQVGDGVTALAVGDEVLGSTMLAGYADQVVVAAEGAVAKPSGLSFATAAGRGAVAASVELVADRSRIGTIVDDEAAAAYGTHVVRAGRDPARLARVVALAAAGKVVLPIRAYPLAEVVEAHRAVETGHGRGKVVLTM